MGVVRYAAYPFPAIPARTRVLTGPLQRRIGRLSFGSEMWDEEPLPTDASKPGGLEGQQFIYSPSRKRLLLTTSGLCGTISIQGTLGTYSDSKFHYSTVR